ncbi:hypothetical protein ACP70R_033014 [Stipagrostis hirtigluma subsp. patula]
MGEIRTELKAWREITYGPLAGTVLAAAIEESLGRGRESNPECTKLEPRDGVVEYRIIVRGAVDMIKLCDCLKEFNFYHARVVDYNKAGTSLYPANQSERVILDREVDIKIRSRTTFSRFRKE